MRLNLTLSARPNSRLSFDYHYALQAVIYKILQKADSTFSAWLHNKGYDSSGRNFKLFTFSDLQSKPFLIYAKEGFIEFKSGQFDWQISFLIDDSMKKFVTGLFLHQSFSVSTPNGRIDFDVRSVAIETPPTLRETMRFRAITPICIRHKTEQDRYPQFLEPTHALYESLFLENLKSKYLASNGLSESGSETTPSVSGSFRLLSAPKKQGMTVVKKELDKPIKIIGYKFDFELTTSLDLMQTGFYAGFGTNNPGGMGFCRVIF
jgi:CRISPR-associated endoribonuclease Cas6